MEFSPHVTISQAEKPRPGEGKGFPRSHSQWTGSNLNSVTKMKMMVVRMLTTDGTSVHQAPGSVSSQEAQSSLQRSLPQH